MSAAHELRVAEMAAALADLPTFHLPPHHVDQVESATRDALSIVEDVGAVAAFAEPGRWSSTKMHRPDAPDGYRAGFVRAVLAIESATFCPHLETGGPQPSIARLRVHRVDCQRCAVTVRKPPPDEADQCEWCHERGITEFTPIIMHVGPMVVIGDACGTCATALKSYASVTQ